MKSAVKELLSTLTGKCLLVLGTLSTIVMGATMRGDWMLAAIMISRQMGWNLEPSSSGKSHFENLGLYLCLSIGVSVASYFGLGGFFQYYYYIKRRNKSEEWKCQPHKFLSDDNERHEILLGFINLFMGSVVSGFIVCHVMNGGYTTLYFSVADHGWLYLVLSSVWLWLVLDAMAFYVHMSGHFPWIYRHIHKWHHRYHQPTAFSATAMHPLEFSAFQAIMFIPIFLFKIHAGAYIVIVLYQYYYGMVDHSGVKMDAIWPWQPSSTFHDNHHEFFHVNFGFNLKFWDWLHDTLRKDNRVYGEDIFYGKGKPLAKTS